MKKAIIILVFGLILFFTIDSCKSDGARSVYCITKDKCITTWELGNGELLIVYGTYKGIKKPVDDYIKVINNRYDNIHLLISRDGKLLIDVDKNATVVKQSSNDLIDLYKNNKTLNDSLYTYFDGKYTRYKKEVDYISLNIKENYATDKNGNKLR